MNFVGKVLVFIILGMSLVFMGFAVSVYATHKNWRNEVEANLRPKLEKAKAENTELQAQREKLESEKNTEIQAKADALVKLETHRKTLEGENAQLIKERDDISSKEKEAVAALESSSQNLQKLVTEVEGLRTEIRTAQDERDKQFAQVVKLTDEMHASEGELTRLKEREKQLAAQVAQARALLNLAGMDVNTPLDKSPPTLRGKVLAINDEKMIEISLGSDDGLRVNHTLEVFRGNKYIGRVIVLNTTTDKAVAKILPEYTKTPIQKGDDVATRLKLS
jgi:cell division protein FtsB